MIRLRHIIVLLYTVSITQCSMHPRIAQLAIKESKSSVNSLVEDIRSNPHEALKTMQNLNAQLYQSEVQGYVSSQYIQTLEQRVIPDILAQIKSYRDADTQTLTLFKEYRALISTLHAELEQLSAELIVADKKLIETQSLLIASREREATSHAHANKALDMLKIDAKNCKKAQQTFERATAQAVDWHSLKKATYYLGYAAIGYVLLGLHNDVCSTTSHTYLHDAICNPFG